VWEFLCQDYELVKSSLRQSLPRLAILSCFFSRNLQCILIAQLPIWWFRWMLLCSQTNHSVVDLWWLLFCDPRSSVLISRSHDDCICYLFKFWIKEFWP
jgi:hypothetical protein